MQKSYLCSWGEISLDYILYIEQKCSICLNFFKSNAVFEISISKGAKWTYSLLLIDNWKKNKFFAVYAAVMLKVRTTKSMKIFLDLLNKDKLMLNTLLTKFWKIYGVGDYILTIFEANDTMEQALWAEWFLVYNNVFENTVRMHHMYIVNRTFLILIKQKVAIIFDKFEICWRPLMALIVKMILTYC